VIFCSAGYLQPPSMLAPSTVCSDVAGGSSIDDGPDAPLPATYPHRGSVRGVVELAAQLLLPVNGLCRLLEKITFISVVSRAGDACVRALQEPTKCAWV